MVEDETKRYRPTKNYLEYFPTPTHTYEVSDLFLCNGYLVHFITAYTDTSFESGAGEDI